MSIFQWNSDYYRSNDESENINDILQREQRIREFSKLTDAAEAVQQLYEDSANVGGSFYNSLILDEEPSYDRMVTEYIKQRDLLFGATEQETQEQDFSLGKRTPSLIMTERGLEVGALEVPTGIGALDPNRDVMWYQTWGTGESNRSIFVTNAQASYLRSQLYATSPFTQRALSRLTPQERQLIPEVPPDIQDRIQTWQQYTNNWERTIASVVELAPPVMIARGIQGKLPSFDGIPIFDQFQRTPDEFFGGYRDPNFKGKAVLELLKKYEPERYQYLLATGMEFNKLDNAKSIFDFQYEMNEHIMKVATTNALLDYQASDPGWFKDSWAMYARPFISGTFNDGDMPADLVITAATWGYGGAYVIGKNIPRFWKGATTGKRIENTVRMIDSLQVFKKFQERAAWFTPTNWATIALNRGTRNFAETLSQMGTKGKIGSYVAYNSVQGAFEGAAYYQLNYMMNIGTNAEYNWDGVQFLKEIAGEAVGQVALGATMNYITSAGIQATMWTGKQMWDSFTPGNIGVEIEPSKIKRLFRDVSTSLNIDPEKWDLLSPEEKKEVAAAIDLNMQLQNLLEIVEGREDTTPYIINAIWGSYENSINKAIAVDALKEVALVIQGRTDDSKLDPKTKEFIKAVKDKYGDKLSSLQIGALLLEAVQIRTSQAMMDGSTRVTDNDASQILGHLMIVSVLEDKAKEMNVKLTTENVKEIQEALKNEGEEKMMERFTQKENELMGLAELRSGGSRVDIKSDSDQELTAADQAAIDRILKLKPNEKISPAITTSDGEQAIAEARRLEIERDEATEQLIREARARDEEAEAPKEAPEAKVIEAEVEPEVVAPEAAPEAPTEVPVAPATQQQAEVGEATTTAQAPEATVTEDKPSTVDIDAQIQTLLEAVVSLNPEQQTIANQILEGMTQENILFKLETLMKEIPETADVLKVIKDC